MNSFIATALLFSIWLQFSLTDHEEARSTTPTISSSIIPIVSPTSAPISPASVSVKAPRHAKKALLYRHLKIKRPRTKEEGSLFPEESVVTKRNGSKKGNWRWFTGRWWTTTTATGSSMSFTNSSASSSYSNSITHSHTSCRQR